MRKLLPVLLLALLPLLAACSNEYKEEMAIINASVEALSTVENGHLTMIADVQAEAGKISAYDSNYLYDYRYRIDVRTFNFVVEKTDLTTGEPLEPSYKVIDAHKYDLATGIEDEEYEGAIGDFPDLLGFYFGAGLKNSYVGSIEPLTDETILAAHPDWQGYRVHKNENYIERVNSSRGKEEADGTMLENYVDYWIDAAGVLVRMDYVSRDQMVYEEVEDIVNQTYTFELLEYNDPAIADF